MNLSKKLLVHILFLLPTLSWVGTQASASTLPFSKQWVQWNFSYNSELQNTNPFVLSQSSSSSLENNLIHSERIANPFITKRPSAPSTLSCKQVECHHLPPEDLVLLSK